MASPTPPTSHIAVHERGVFREDNTLPGQIAFRLYHCKGKLVEIALIDVDEWFDDGIEDELRASLDRRCPPNGCSGDHRRRRHPLSDGRPIHLV